MTCNAAIALQINYNKTMIRYYSLTFLYMNALAMSLITSITSVIFIQQNWVVHLQSKVCPLIRLFLNLRKKYIIVQFLLTIYYFYDLKAKKETLTPLTQILCKYKILNYLQKRIQTYIYRTIKFIAILLTR